MRKTLSIIFSFCLALIGIVTFSATSVDAAAQTQSANYTVQAELPDNQINKKVNFFDLKVTPNSTQDLKIRVNNNDTKDHQYLVEVNQAFTNSNGIVDYSQHGLKKDPSLKYDIESMFGKPQTVTVPANSSKEVVLKMTTPKGDFKGMILGGIRVMQLKQTNKPKNIPGKALNVQNQYAYILGLQIQQNTNAVKPVLKMDKGLATRENQREVIAARLQNSSPTLINQAQVKTEVTPEGGSNIVLKSNKKNLSFAPNSTFDLNVNNADQALKAGKYTMRISAKGDKGTQAWAMKKNFIITKAEANELSQTAKNSPAAIASRPNYKLIIAIAALAAVLIVGLLIWNFKLQRNSRH